MQAFVSIEDVFYFRSNHVCSQSISYIIQRESTYYYRLSVLQHNRPSIQFYNVQTEIWIDFLSLLFSFVWAVTLTHHPLECKKLETTP